ncbi:FKBP-type peptidyl-prolyl cis-trans isomerase N-terminal domain-containing protein [Acinetobacter nectaris]|uniref:FKBP-type peptidyl-prolyl cis-trans isomerase N-terminal domain-containing protein n=1 Tax=Acinetobacter nectaris TaxID=1219382 RepID=UPI001F1CD9B4|nr:FKBP-type peptidyl-prolyl cis-trans isomerase N-terminal domain-containing protein [Acinetobacter nectaris]MCF9034114.1 FKBP-type peptidyl-prolyl cis-trans isomerase [Acinetobacter nectaris]
MNRTLLGLLSATFMTTTFASNTTTPNEQEEGEKIININNIQTSRQQNTYDTNSTERVFFVENSRRLGVVTTDSGLQYQVLKAGLSRMPRIHHNVRISYEIRNLNDRLILRQTDQSVRLSRLMPALSEGIQTMREKGKTRFFIPTGLTSGIKDLSASIPENTSLIIDVELQGIE